MKHNHVLIDYENVEPDGAAALTQSLFKVWVFVGAQQAKVKFNLLNCSTGKSGSSFGRRQHINR